ncbi:MAG: hypothetical protein WC421_08750 [Elusimicrobiales bacterium]
MQPPDDKRQHIPQQKPAPEKGPGEESSAVSPSKSPSGDSVEDIKLRLAETEKRLAAEKEKSLIADVRAKQEEAFAAKVEASLKDIQQKIQRDKREREIEEERAQLREKVRELDSRLMSERESWAHVLRSQLQQPAPQRPEPAPSPDSAILSRLEKLEQKWSGGAPHPAQQDLPARLGQLEEGLAAAQRDKQALVSELAQTRAAFLEQISQLMSRMRDDTARVSPAQQPASVIAYPPYPPFGYQQAAPQAQPVPAQAAPAPAADDNSRQQMLEAQRTAQERLAALEIAEQDKLRAINGLMRLKSALIKMKAVNVALDRELKQLLADKERFETAARESDALAKKLQVEKEADSAAARLTAALAQKLKEDLDSQNVNADYLKRRMEEKNIQIQTLESEMRRVQREQQDKTEEFAALLSTRAREYQNQFEELEKQISDYKDQIAGVSQKLSDEQTLRQELEKALVAANVAAQKTEEEMQAALDQNTLLDKAKANIAADKARLAQEFQQTQAEKAELTFKMFKAQQQSQELFRQTQVLNQMLAQMNDKAAHDARYMEELRAMIEQFRRREQAVVTANSQLRAMLSDEIDKAAVMESGLKGILMREVAAAAELKRRLDRYDAIAKTAISRLKWTLFGKG